MDGNLNIQQHNMQQPTGEVMYHQMQQPMMYQQIPQQMTMNPMGGKKKSKKGLFIGLTVTLMLVIIVGVLFFVFACGEEGSFEGTWVGKDGTEVSFIDDGDKDGFLRFDIIIDGEEVTSNVTKYGKELRFITEEWNDEEGAYEYEFHNAKIKKLTNSKLVLEYEGKKYTFKRK